MGLTDGSHLRHFPGVREKSGGRVEFSSDHRLECPPLDAQHTCAHDTRTHIGSLCVRRLRSSSPRQSSGTFWKVPPGAPSMHWASMIRGVGIDPTAYNRMGPSSTLHRSNGSEALRGGAARQAHPEEEKE
eukprot:5647144-Pyramimonas_sp.AAC.1